MRFISVVGCDRWLVILGGSIEIWELLEDIEEEIDYTMDPEIIIHSTSDKVNIPNIPYEPNSDGE